MRPGVVVVFLAVSTAGCLGAVSSQAGDIEDHVLAEGWGQGNPSATVLASVDGVPWRGQINAPPTVHDLDGDGTEEILAHGSDRNVRVFDGDTGRQLGTMPVTYPPSWRIDSVLNTVAVGSLDGERLAVVVASPAAVITAWDVAPQEDGTISFSKRWETRANTCFSGAGMDAGPVLADLDGEPGMEVLVQTEQIGIYALTGDGEILWHHCWGGGNAAPAADDLDRDGDLEAVFASDGGFISVLDGATGQPLWTFDASHPRYGILPASVVTAPTIADIDGEGFKEVLFTARHAPRDDPDAFDDFHMAIFAVHQDEATYQAELVWMRQPEWANPLSNTQIIVEDVDGDGRADIFGMDWNTIGHHPGEWQPFEEGHLFRLDRDGRDVWVRPLTSWWSNKQITLADGDGDGEVEVLVAAPRAGTDGIWRIDAGTGRPEGFLTAGPWSLTTGPVALSGERYVVAGRLEGEERAALILYEVKP